MDGDALSIGSSGSLVANLLLLAVMENVSEPPWGIGYGVSDTRTQAAHVLEPLDSWRPFMDDPGWGGQRRRSCPEPRATHAGGVLPQAPLPPGYDPYAPREQPFHACLLVSSDGEILSAKLLGSSGSASLDGRIMALIATRWQVEPPAGANAPSWQRVRLNAGPDEGEVYESPVLE
jgi:hypothetical protein